MYIKNIMESLSISMQKHPIRLLNINIQEAYYIVLKKYLEDYLSINEYAGINLELYKQIFSIDTEQISMNYTTAKKIMNKKVYITLENSKIKVSTEYAKHSLICDLFWITNGAIDVNKQAQLARDFKINKQEFQQLLNFCGFLYTGDLQQLSIYKKMHKKYKKYRSLVYYTEQIENMYTHNLKNEFNVAVIATMSAGKSTFMNTLTNTDIFPVQNQACTAKITSYKHNANIDHVIGRAMIDENQFIHQGVVTSEVLKEWNANDQVKSIYLEGNIPWITKESNYSIVLNDTPGTNYSQDATHQRVTLDFLKSCKLDMIFYIVNATQIATEDDRFLLESIKGIIQKTNTKIVFLLNKVDLFDVEADDNIECSLGELQDYIQKIGFSNFELIPISAYGAKLFKEAMNGKEFNKKQQREFEELIELFNDENYNLNRLYAKHNMPDHTADRLDNALIKTNIPVIQEVLNNHISA